MTAALKTVILLLAALAAGACSSGADGSMTQVPPMYEFYCRHEALLCAIAIEPHCGPEPVIHFGVTDDGTPHAEAYCEGLGYVRIVGYRTMGVYPSPGVPMRVTVVYRIEEYLLYFFGWMVDDLPGGEEG